MVPIMFGRRFIRWLATTVLAGLVLAILFGVVGEFFIELARERGLYQDPSRRFGVAMTAFSEFVTQAWFMSVAALSFGFAAGLWLDTLLRRREQATVSIDRLALADRASAIAAKVSEIYGQWQADQSVAWHEDSYKLDTAIRAGQHPFSIRSSSDNVARKYIERYSEQCNAEVWSVIGLARKVVVVERSTHWRLSNGVSSASDLYGIVAFLGHIEASLRHDQIDLPMFDEHQKRADYMEINRSAETEIQSPQDNAVVKQP